jgi:hypothetical protein
MALAGIFTALTIQACDNYHQNLPVVEASEETHIVDYDLVQLGDYKPFYSVYVKFDDGTVFHCISVENSSNDSKTSALVCK